MIFKQVEEPEYRVIHRIADGLRREMVQAFLSAVATFAGRITLRRIEEALHRGDLGSAEAEIPWDDLPPQLESFAAILERTVGRAAEASEEHLPRSIGLSLRFDLLNPRSVEFIEQHSEMLVREVSDETRTAVRDVIRRA